MKAIRILHWAPRTLCILAILFISLFALDSFDPRLTFWQQIQGFLMHLIPSFLLTFFLIFAWKYELAGGIILAIIGLGFTPMVFSMNYHHNQSVWISLSIVAMITLPFFLTGILFILSHYVKKKHTDN